MNCFIPRDAIPGRAKHLPVSPEIVGGEGVRLWPPSRAQVVTRRSGVIEKLRCQFSGVIVQQRLMEIGSKIEAIISHIDPYLELNKAKSCHSGR